MKLSLEQNLLWIILILLLGACLLVLWPFVTALVWAAVLSFTCWPIHRRLCGWFGGRHTLAALSVSLAMILAVLLPFVIVGFTLADNVTTLRAAAERWVEAGPPKAPAWVAKVPVVGQAAAKRWDSLVADTPSLRERFKRLLEPAAGLILKGSLKLTAGLFELGLSILVTFFLLRHGAAVADTVTRSVGRIAGDRGKRLLEVAGDTVRGVVYGILGTAIVQAMMAGIGFVVAGVPGASLLSLLVFFLSVVPGGPLMVVLPAAVWLFGQGETGWGIFMLVWGMGVSTVDNFVRPWLISQGSDLPFLLILFGILGGAVAFGFIGIFIGPTLLAVGYQLVKVWFMAGRAGSENEAWVAAPSSAG